MMTENEDLVFVSENKDGNFYFGYRVNVQRGIKGKTRSKVDELIIVGMPREKALEKIKKEGIRLEDYYSKQSD